MNKLRVIFLSVFLLITLTSLVFSLTYYSYGGVTGGAFDPTNTSNWWSASDGTGTHPADFTNAADIFFIRGIDNAVATANWTVAGKIQVIGTLSPSPAVVVTCATLDGFSGNPTGKVYVTSVSGTNDFHLQYAFASVALDYLTVCFTGSGAAQGVDGYTYIKGLTIFNSTGANLNGNATVNGTLELTSGILTTTGYTLTLGDGATIILGDGLLSAAPTFGTSINITYAGTGDQTTNDGKEFPSTDILNNLTIANTNGVFIDRPVTVNGTLHFSPTNGCNLLIGGNNLTLKGAADPGAGYCVITDGTGMVIRTIDPAGTFGFPIGPAAGKWNCVQLTNQSGSPQTYYGRVTTSVLDVGNVETTAKVTWHIYCTTAGASTDIQFHWFTADKGTLLSQNTETIWRNTAASGGTWNEQAPVYTRTAGTPNTTLGAVMTALSTSTYRFTVGTPTALPVQMTSFTTKMNKLNTELQWSTATEKNCYGFDVERRIVGSTLSSGKNWQKIGFVPGSGTSNSPHEYSFIDPSPLSGRSAYQLKQIDNDGTFEYSQSVEVESGMIPDKFGLLQNYPNPFNPTTTITYALPEASRVSLKVFDMLGKEVATLVNETKDAGSYEVKFNANNLSSGMYFYQLRTGNYSETKKLLLTK